MEGRNRTPQPSHIRTRRSPVIRLLFSNLTLRRSQFPVSKELGIGLRKPVHDGVGLITATALLAAVGDPKAFKNGREFSAWLGLTPRQCSTGGKTTLLGISKRGDSYLRKNLIHGCRTVVYHAQNKDDKKSRWIKEKLKSKGTNKVSVALANKTARAIWAVLARKEEYKRAS